MCNLRDQCRKDVEGAKGFLLTMICLAGLVWIVESAITHRGSLIFWLEWEKAALIVSGVISFAFWLAAFFWPKQHFELTTYKTAGTAFSFFLAGCGSGALIWAGFTATAHGQEMQALLEQFRDGVGTETSSQSQELSDIRKELAAGFLNQSTLLAIGIFLLCCTQGMFLWGSRHRDDEEAKRLRKDYRNCLLFSDVPCCVIFVIIFFSIGLHADQVSSVAQLLLFKVFIAGAVALQVSLSNIVYLIEFAEGPRRLYESFLSAAMLPIHTCQLAYNTVWRT